MVHTLYFSFILHSHLKALSSPCWSLSSLLLPGVSLLLAVGVFGFWFCVDHHVVVASRKVIFGPVVAVVAAVALILIPDS